MMSRAIKTIAAAAIAVSMGIGTAAYADGSDGYVSYSKQGEFSEVLQDLQDAIINRGLVIDFVGHVDMMLERTSDVAGSVTAEGAKSPYVNAKYVQFCSAKLTHNAVSASPLNLAICPYVTFAFETRSEPGKVTVGYRRPIPGPSKATKAAFAKIEGLLDEITKEAAAE